MIYLYTILGLCELTTCLTERYKHLHRHTLVFINFYLEYSMFYTLQNTLFSKIMFYPLFTV
nr:MAG TPA: hypothetical protein [Caudoviricetes sp.]